MLDAFVRFHVALVHELAARHVDEAARERRGAWLVSARTIVTASPDSAKDPAPGGTSGM